MGENLSKLQQIYLELNIHLPMVCNFLSIFHKSHHTKTKYKIQLKPAPNSKIRWIFKSKIETKWTVKSTISMTDKFWLKSKDFKNSVYSFNESEIAMNLVQKSGHPSHWKLTFLLNQSFDI